MHTQRMKEYLGKRIRPDDDFNSLLFFPSYFEIETIHACNARCVMCPGMSPARPRGPMEGALYSSVVDQVARHRDHVHRFSLFRDGEPLLDKGLENRVREAKEAGIRCVSTTTNISLMSEERAEGLLRSGLDMIDISIDGHSKEVFESIRRGLSFERVVSNTLTFIKLRDHLAPDCVIRIRMVLQDANRSEWKKFRAYWESRLSNADSVLYHPLHNWGGKFDHAREYPTLPCVSLWSLMVVHVDGGVPPCSGIEDLTGSLAETPIDQVWHARTFEAMRMAHLHGDRMRIENCRNCLAWAPPSHAEDIDADYAKAE